MLNTLVFLSFLIGPITGDGFRCLFPGETDSEKPIEITLEPHPSLKDRPGLFQVTMRLNGLISIRAHAQPIAKTAERDVVILGRLGKDASYSVGLREDGLAALNLKTGTDGAALKNRLIRSGQCHGYKPHINRWLP